MGENENLCVGQDLSPRGQLAPWGTALEPFLLSQLQRKGIQ